MSALNPQILGLAENAHRAILNRALNGTGLTYESYVALKIASGGPVPAVAFPGTIAGALKVDPEAADQIIADLAAAGLLTADSSLTDQARDLLDRIGAAVGSSVAGAYAGIPAEDLETAGRVLTLITDRLTAILTT